MTILATLGFNAKLKLVSLGDKSRGVWRGGVLKQMEGQKEAGMNKARVFSVTEYNSLNDTAMSKKMYHVGWLRI